MHYTVPKQRNIRGHVVLVHVAPRAIIFTPGFTSVFLNDTFMNCCK